MITRDIVTKVNENFTEYVNMPLVADDVRAYRFIFSTFYDLTGCTFIVTATRADGVKITDAGTVQGNIGYYTVKNNMYSVVGETRFRLTIQSADGSALTSKEIICEVAEANGSANITADDRLPILTTLINQTTAVHNRFKNFVTDDDELDGASLKDGSVGLNKIAHRYCTVGKDGSQEVDSFETRLTGWNLINGDDSLWSDTDNAFVIPEGVSKIKASCCIALYGESVALVDIKILQNDADPISKSSYTKGAGEAVSVYLSTFILDVEAGQKIQLELLADGYTTPPVVYGSTEFSLPSWFSLEIIE